MLTVIWEAKMVGRHCVVKKLGENLGKSVFIKISSLWALSLIGFLGLSHLTQDMKTPIKPRKNNLGAKIIVFFFLIILMKFKTHY